MIKELLELSFAISPRLSATWTLKVMQAAMEAGNSPAQMILKVGATPYAVVLQESLRPNVAATVGAGGLARDCKDEMQHLLDQRYFATTLIWEAARVAKLGQESREQVNEKLSRCRFQ